MTLSRVKLYTRGAFKSKGIVSSTVFVKRTLIISKLIIRNIELFIIGEVTIRVVEIEVDVPSFVYINCFLSSKYIT